MFVVGAGMTHQSWRSSEPHGGGVDIDMHAASAMRCSAGDVAMAAEAINWNRPQNGSKGPWFELREIPASVSGQSRLCKPFGNLEIALHLPPAAA